MVPTHSGRGPAVTDDIPDLFDDVPQEDEGDQSPEDLLGPHGERARLVRISSALNKASPGADFTRVRLNFFPPEDLGVQQSGAGGGEPIELVALLSQPKTEDGASVLLGRLEEDEDSWLTIVSQDSAFTLTLNSLVYGLFEVVVHDPEANLFVARKLDEDSLPDCGVTDDQSHDGGQQDEDTPGEEGAAASEPVIIDLLVVYTRATRDKLKTDEAVRARALEAVVRGNQVFSNSNLNIQLRLVHCALLPNYVEPSVDRPFYVMLDQLERGTAPGLEGLHALRKAHKADVVSLLVADNSLGGLANVMGEPPRASFGRSAYNVVYYYVAASTWTLLHEVGHNLGACHEAPCVRKRQYGQGFVFKAGDPAKLYKTVMVRKKLAGQRIPYFSSSDPAVRYRGVPTGDGGHDNSKVVRAGAPVTSRFGEAL